MERIKLNLLTQLTTPFLSAGSGMAWFGGEMFIIADDELKLFSYPVKLDHTGASWPLFPGKLPKDHHQRKKLKPDLESLVEYNQHLYCFPSGSTPNRMTGVKWNLSTKTPQTFDCRPLYEILERTFSELNIEGCVVRKHELILFQRGNGKKHENGLIFVDFKTLTLKSIKKVELGKLDGVPLSFTDAAMSGDKIYFLAVAENSESTYEDGSIQGSVIGSFNLQDEVDQIYLLETKSKPEGLWVEGNEFFIITDDDQPLSPSCLLKGLIP